jgi:DeoR/GlpR family transcriptional regulator of sugar metabolism
VNYSHSGRSDRAAAIVAILLKRVAVGFSELAREFGVSEMTIRRDAEALVDAGQVIRVPGGVRIARGFPAEKSFLEREHRMSSQKENIGKAAASLVCDGEAIVLDSGTTTLYIARHLRERQCTVFTFSLAALVELAESRSVRVEVIGGVYRPSSHDFVSSAVGEALGSIRADKVFFGAAALSPESGVMVNDPEAQRALLKSGRERILVVDSSKFGLEALYRFCELKSCDLIITDADAPAGALEKIKRFTRVRIAE